MKIVTHKSMEIINCGIFYQIKGDICKVCDLIDEFWRFPNLEVLSINVSKIESNQPYANEVDWLIYEGYEHFNGLFGLVLFIEEQLDSNDILYGLEIICSSKKVMEE